MAINILFLIQSLQKGGAERVASIVMNNLIMNKKYNITLLTLHGIDEKYQYEIHNEIKVVKSNQHDWAQSISDTILNNKIDLVINFICSMEYVSFISTNYPDIKLIYTIHNSPFYFRYHFLEFLNIAKKSDVTIVLTSYIYKILKLCGIERVAIIPNINTINTYETVLTPVNNTKNIVCIGDFTRDRGNNKRLDRAIKVLSEVKKNNKDAILYVVGLYDLKLKVAQSDQTLEELIKSLNLKIGKDIAFKGIIHDMDSIYKDAAVCILTSTSEGMPMVVLEAGAYGVPVVANKINGLEDIILNGENGFIVEQDDIHAMAEKVSLLLNNHKLRYKTSTSASKLAAAFNKDNIIPKWEKLIYTTLTNDKISTESILNSQNSAFNNYTIEDYKNISIDAITFLTNKPDSEALIIHIYNPFVKKIFLIIKYILKKLHLLNIIKKFIS